LIDTGVSIGGVGKIPSGSSSTPNPIIPIGRLKQSLKSTQFLFWNQRKAKPKYR
jgi:hypothetical protein